MKISDRIKICEKYEGETKATKAIKRWIASEHRVMSDEFGIFFTVRHKPKPDGKGKFDIYHSYEFKKDTMEIVKILYQCDSIEGNSEI
jgi:hypothetical protein